MIVEIVTKDLKSTLIKLGYSKVDIKVTKCKNPEFGDFSSSVPLILGKIHKKNPIDIVLSTGPPHSMHMIGLGLKNTHQVKWIADFRDPWSNFIQNKLLNKLDLTIKKHEKAEADVLKNCDGVFTTSESLKSKFSIKNNFFFQQRQV